MKVTPVDRKFVNIAVKLQLLQLKKKIDIQEALNVALILQDISCGYGDMPNFCDVCGESTADCNEVVRNYVDVGVGGGGLPTEISYTCKLCNTQLNYWAHGTWYERIYEQYLNKT